VKLSTALKKRLIAAREASRVLRSATSELKNAVLLKAASLLIERQNQVIKANQADLKSLPPKTLPAFRDRLMLNEARIAHMAESLKQVAALPDPVGEVIEERRLSNGLRLRKLRAPLGVIYHDSSRWKRVYAHRSHSLRYY
jgi:glutamate-5-semialdehyde dehydrogenase